MSTPEQHKATTRRLFEYLSTLRFQEARELLDPDAKWWDDERGYFDTSEMEATSGPFADHYVDGIKVTIHSMTAEGDRVAVEAESFAPMKNGTIYNNKYLFLVGFTGGRISLIKEYHDTQHAFEIVSGLGDQADRS